MIGPLVRVAICCASLSVALGCRSALTEPLPVAEIGDAAGPAETELGRALDTVSEARIEFEKRPDAAAVERSRRLYLEAARVEGGPVEAFLGAARAGAWLVEHEEDGQRRAELAVEGVQISQHCVRLHPAVAECTYRLALAVGQQARERPSTAVDGLGVMVKLLDEVIASAPELDHAGGDRVMALVLLRAPGWPTGPGDPETALVHAETAVRLFPNYPPNQLVFAEALRANDRPREAGHALRRAADRARADLSAGDPDAAEWLVEAETGLTGFR